MPEMVFGIHVAPDWVDLVRKDVRVRMVKRGDEGDAAFAEEAATAGGFVVLEAGSDCDSAL